MSVIAQASGATLVLFLASSVLLSACERQPQGVVRLDDPVLKQREIPDALALDTPLRHALARPRATPDVWYHVYAAERVGDGFVRYMQIRTAWSGADYANHYAWYAVECGIETRQRLLGEGPRASDAEQGRAARPARTIADDSVNGRIANYMCRATEDCPAHDRDKSSRCRAEWHVEQDARAEMHQEQSSDAASRAAPAAAR